jgi:hypothetical protein
MKRAFHAKNTFEKLSYSKRSINNQYVTCSVYKHKCLNFPGIYIGQTAHTFKIKYNEHMQTVRNNSEK